MKKEILFLSGFLLLISCDPGGVAHVLIDNQCDVDGFMTFYVNDEETRDTTFEIQSGRITELFQMSALGVTDFSLSFEEDSIIIEFVNHTFIRYYQDSILASTKSIYNESDWDNIKIGRNEFEFVFTITDEDVRLDK